MNIRGIDISSGNVEDILAVLDILVADLSNVKDEIKELKSFESQKLQSSVKKIEEIEGEIFNLLSSATQLYNKIQELNENIDIKKSNFEEEVISLIEDTLKEVANELVYIKNKFESALREVVDAPNKISNSYSKLIDNFTFTINHAEEKLKRTINNIKNDLTNSITEVENTSKNAIRSIEEYLENTKIEIDQKTFFQRWGAVFIAFFIGAIITIAIIFYFLKNDIIFSLKYSNTCYNDDNSTYKCYAIPIKKGTLDSTNQYYLINKN